MRLDPARLTQAPDGTPVSEAYGDVYYSSAGGPAQAQHVFLTGNELPQRWQGKEQFTILETGFGLGLNFMATWQAWKNDPQRCRELHFISVEKHPFVAEDLARAHAVWPEFSSLSKALCRNWPPLVSGEHSLVLGEGSVVLHLIFGDACAVLSALDAGVDAFYLDGFSPSKNPELWSPDLCCSLSRLAHPGATLATWSVAGQVRKALATAGFVVRKTPGFAAKRQMLVGEYVPESLNCRSDFPKASVER